MRRAFSFVFSGLFVLAALISAGCGGAGAEGGGTVPPASRGQVWEVDGAGEAGALVAFVNGLHVAVVDGDSVFAGMTELKATNAADGARRVSFPSGLAADFRPAGDRVELRFSTGEAVTIRERRSE